MSQTGTLTAYGKLQMVFTSYDDPQALKIEDCLFFLFRISNISWTSSFFFEVSKRLFSRSVCRASEQGLDVALPSGH